MAIVYRDGQPGKICTKCGEWHSVEKFRHRLLSRDGYNSICRLCENENARRWRKNNSDRIAELNRGYYEENREERKIYHRQYRQEHQDYFREKMQEFREENPSYHREYMREWGRAFPDKVQEKDNKRRALKHNAGPSFTAKEWNALKRQYNYTCLRCGRKEPEITLTVDHIVPLSQGGKNTIDNIQPLCKPCNSAKHDDTIDYRPSWRDE